VLADARAAREALKMWFAVDTLEFLKRSGRIGGAAAWIGSTLKIKPILTVESEMAPVERVRTSRRAFERMVDYARQRQESGADGWVVQHIQAHDEAERLIDACREVFGCEPAFTSEIGPVLAAHTGPGLLGVGGVPRPMLVDD
jgi:DegV family protein with EDD domain